MCFTKYKGIFLHSMVESLNFFCSERNDGSDRSDTETNKKETEAKIGVFLFPYLERGIAAE